MTIELALSLAAFTLFAIVLLLAAERDVRGR